LKYIYLIILFLSTLDAKIPDGIEEILSKYSIDASSISIDIEDIDTGVKVATLNQDVARIPASIAKVFTTYSSILHLGFNYRYSTLFYYTGTIANGILNGDLIIKPYGDPNLNSNHLIAIVSKIKSKGINQIKGDIIIDRSFFDIPNLNSSGFDKHKYSPYNAMPDSMMFNERVSTIFVKAGSHGVKIKKKDNDGSYKVLNKVRAVNGSCRGSRSWVNIKVNEDYDRPLVVLSGTLSKRCDTKEVCKVLTKPYRAFYYALKKQMSEQGILNRARLKLAKTPRYSKNLFIYKSKPLQDIVSTINKDSNNVMARQLMLTLGGYIFNRPCTIYKGRKAIKKILISNGVKLDKRLFIDNGSGLSRNSIVTATSFTNLLRDAFNSEGQKWLDTLSIAGVDGTTKKRFKNSIVKGRGWFKTGTINKVKNIIGYVNSYSGRIYSVVILINDPKSGWDGASIQNDILKWLVYNY
jgi:D-alanyl-D-alanine carboxypeptidase/D-alanyl-D-alanine-endopeptidase (penicillin-binding protein 4)